MIVIPSPFGRLIPQNLALVFGEFWAWKTFYTVLQAFAAYLRGDVVISNMWLAFPHVRWYVSDDLPAIIHAVQDYHDDVSTPSYAPNSYLFSHDIEKINQKPRQFFFLVDEGGLFFNARNFKKNFDNPKMLEFFVQPRKYDCTIAIIAQNLNMLDVNFRRLAQDVIEFRKWILGLFRLGESYDPKYLRTEEWGWDPETPVIRRKFYLHPFYTQKSKVQFFGWLYYTKEILGDRAVRHPSHILSLDRFLTLEQTDINFHGWQMTYKLAKQQLFALSEKEEKEDSENAPYYDKK